MWTFLMGWTFLNPVKIHPSMLTDFEDYTQRWHTVWSVTQGTLWCLTSWKIPWFCFLIVKKIKGFSSFLCLWASFPASHTNKLLTLQGICRVSLWRNVKWCGKIMLRFAQAMERQTCGWACVSASMRACCEEARMLRATVQRWCQLLLQAENREWQGLLLFAEENCWKHKKVTPITPKPNLPRAAGESHREQVQRISNPSWRISKLVCLIRLPWACKDKHSTSRWEVN